MRPLCQNLAGDMPRHHTTWSGRRTDIVEPATGGSDVRYGPPRCGHPATSVRQFESPMRQLESVTWQFDNAPSSVGVAIRATPVNNSWPATRWRASASPSMQRRSAIGPASCAAQGSAGSRRLTVTNAHPRTNARSAAGTGSPAIRCRSWSGRNRRRCRR